MQGPSKEEKDAEIKLIKDFVLALIGRIQRFFKRNDIGIEITKLQDYDDDGGTDGIFRFINIFNSKSVSLECRAKGYVNHEGEICEFPRGWQTGFLSKGIFINESILRRHKENKENFIYLVDILCGTGLNKHSERRACVIDESRIDELLKQPYKLQRSTNTKNPQSIKLVPLKWFENRKF